MPRLNKKSVMSIRESENVAGSDGGGVKDESRSGEGQCAQVVDAQESVSPPGSFAICCQTSQRRMIPSSSVLSEQQKDSDESDLDSE